MICEFLGKLLNDQVCKQRQKLLTNVIIANEVSWIRRVIEVQLVW